MVKCAFRARSSRRRRRFRNRKFSLLTYPFECDYNNMILSSDPMIPPFACGRLYRFILYFVHAPSSLFVPIPSYQGLSQPVKTKRLGNSFFSLQYICRSRIIVTDRFGKIKTYNELGNRQVLQIFEYDNALTILKKFL